MTFNPNWGAIAQILGGALAAPNGQYAQGAQQGAQGYQQMQGQQQEQQYREQQMRLAQQQADQQAAKFQSDQAADQQWRDMFNPQQPQSAQQIGNYGASVGGSAQTASGSDPMSSLIAGLSPQQRAMLSMAGRNSGMDLLADYMKPADQFKPNLQTFNDKGVSHTGYYDQQGQWVEQGSSPQWAPQQPQQAPAANLITLVAPDGKTTRSFDSRDPNVKALASQGWVERQNSMFPAPPSGYAAGAPTAEGQPTQVPVKGGPADPANPNNITADQRKTASFATRLESANSIIDTNENVGTDYWQEGLSSAPLVGTMLASTEKQSLNQAQRDFINAQLRRESGATIQDTEFQSAAQQYFPQPGEGKDIVAQKRAARKIAIDNMKREAGAALPPTSPSDDGGWTVIDGVKIRKKN